MDPRHWVFLAKVQRSFTSFLYKSTYNLLKLMRKVDNFDPYWTWFKRTKKHVLVILLRIQLFRLFNFTVLVIWTVLKMVTSFQRGQGSSVAWTNSAIIEENQTKFSSFVPVFSLYGLYQWDKVSFQQNIEILTNNKCKWDKASLFNRSFKFLRNNKCHWNTPSFQQNL